MGFVKIIKNKAYCKRMQVKPKRRRQGKTDYYARRRLTMQRKNKYDSKKYRFVVRRTCSKFITQIIYSTMTGDKVLCAAESTELRQHGLTAGLTNFSAGYCTGLLLARRLLKQVGLADMYKGNQKVDGELYNVDSDVQEDKRPFKALMDVGIQRTTTGARIFAVLKGACDGGLNIPHNTKRFAGYSRGKVEAVTNKRGKAVDNEKTAATYNAKVMRDRIFGAHVNTYMNQLKKEDAARFKRQFSQWEKCLADAKVKSCEELYKKVHEAIKKDPSRKKAAGNAKPTRKVVTPGKALVLANSKGKKWIAYRRLTREQRQERVQAKFAAAMAASK
jgi:large subunit ribosomal protein L5e